jgi:hypothetical protein
VETVGTSASGSFGVSVVGSCVVYAEYGLNSAADQARRAYQSDNFGVTWRKIYEGPQNGTGSPPVATWHTHDVRYDPYEDLVWIVNGDGPANANISYRKRTTTGFAGWTKVFPDGQAPLQWTTIIPLQSCVLFLSDNYNQSIWRYDRRTHCATATSIPVVEMANSIELSRTPEPISSTPHVDRTGSVHVGYFGWTVNSSNSKILYLYATVDGHNFYPIWRTPRAPLNEGQADTFVGIIGVTGKTSAGELLVDYRDRILGGNNGNLIRVPIPAWVAQ